MEPWDVIVIGGGAAGLMAGASAAGLDRRVLILEKNTKLGVKILMSGGTRCNITHNCSAGDIAIAYGAQGNFLRSALAALPPEEVIRLIEAQGVETKVESTGKIFPVSDRAIDVRDALVLLAQQAGATLQTNQSVQSIEPQANDFLVRSESNLYSARTVILTTGGKSYPGCGTTGDGYAWAKNLGHTIVDPVPALTPVCTSKQWVRQIKGITIDDVHVSVCESQRFSQGDKTAKPIASSRGSFLFTHFGFSGPPVLNVSRTISRHATQNKLSLVCDFLPAIAHEQLHADLKNRFDRARKQQAANVFADLFPKRLIEAILNESAIDPSKRCAELSKREAEKICQQIKQAHFPVSGVLGFNKAEVTAGGVDLSQINSRTMESKLQRRLFFAGEILDVDGPIGGYNFQAAFSTGWLAGQSAAAAMP